MKNRINCLSFATQFAAHIDAAAGSSVLSPLLMDAHNRHDELGGTEIVQRFFETIRRRPFVASHLDALEAEGLLDSGAALETPIGLAGRLVEILDFMDERAGQGRDHWKICMIHRSAVTSIAHAFFASIDVLEKSATTQHDSPLGGLLEAVLVGRSPLDLIGLLDPAAYGHASVQRTQELQARWGTLMADPEKLQLVARIMAETVPPTAQVLWLEDVIRSPEMSVWTEVMSARELERLLRKTPVPTPDRLHREAELQRERRPERSHERV